MEKRTKMLFSGRQIILFQFLVYQLCMCVHFTVDSTLNNTNSKNQNEKNGENKTLLYKLSCLLNTLLLFS